MHFTLIRKLASVSLFLFAFLHLAKGQGNYTFNYNIYNGLPSNQVYGMITDRHGYLWLATNNGVARYNGYEFKTFGLSEGLPKLDIWEVLEDKKGRIWVCTIGDEFGYLYNEKYHKVFLKNIDRSIYPKEIRVSGNGIIFSTPLLSGNNQPTICTESNDTIYKTILSDTLFSKSDKAEILKKNKINTADDTANANIMAEVNSDDGGAYLLCGNILYKYNIASHVHPVDRVAKFNVQVYDPSLENYRYFFINSYFVYYGVREKSNMFAYANVKDGTTTEVAISKYGVTEKINFIYYKKNTEKDKNIFVITNKYVLKFNCDSGIRFQEKYIIENVINSNATNGTDIFTFFHDPIWNNCIGSGSQGLYINNSFSNHFVPVGKINLKNYSYKGSIPDSVSFWWSQATKTLLWIDKKLNVKKEILERVSKPHTIRPYSGDSLLIHGEENYAFIFNTKKLAAVNNFSLKHGVLSSFSDSGGTSFLLASIGFFVNICKNGRWENTVRIIDRFDAMIYDSIRKNVWVYNNSRIFIRTKDEDSLTFSKEAIMQFGIKKIKYIEFDNKYGNILFEGPDCTSLYFPEKKTHIELFKNMNLKDAKISIYHNTIIAAGSFGVAFCKIKGPLAVSNPIIYPNIKNANYIIINDLSTQGGQLLLNTDRGLYRLFVPSDSELLSASEVSGLFASEFILRYWDTIINIRSGDTINLSQTQRRLQFDVINPNGNGLRKYMYQLPGDSAWHELNANELNIPAKFDPGQYYTLSLKVYDDVWRSDPVHLHFYIRPRWYQANPGKTLAGIATAVLLFIIFGSSVLITRKMVLNAAKKKKPPDGAGTEGNIRTDKSPFYFQYIKFGFITGK